MGTNLFNAIRVDVGNLPDILRVAVSEPGLQDIVASIHTLVRVELRLVQQDRQEVWQVGGLMPIELVLLRVSERTLN